MFDSTQQKVKSIVEASTFVVIHCVRGFGGGDGGHSGSRRLVGRLALGELVSLELVVESSEFALGLFVQLARLGLSGARQARVRRQIEEDEHETLLCAVLGVEVGILSIDVCEM